MEHAHTVKESERRDRAVETKSRTDRRAGGKPELGE
jgi:hypothetical protein